MTFGRGLNPFIRWFFFLWPELLPVIRRIFEHETPEQMFPEIRSNWSVDSNNDRIDVYVLQQSRR